MTPVERDRGPTSETMRARVLAEPCVCGDPASRHEPPGVGPCTWNADCLCTEYRANGAPANPYLADPPVYCDHGYVLPWADHPAAGVESCPHGCTEKRA